MGKTIKSGGPIVGIAVRYKGIEYAAKELGTSANHLRFVLQGKRSSKSLMARVRAEFPGLVRK
jgi:hypothetical protein